MIDKIKNMIQRLWSKTPDRIKGQMPDYFHKNARLDAVRVRAKKCASVPIVLYNKMDLRKNGDNAKPILDHELYELLDNPCPTFKEIDGWTLRFLTTAHILLAGEFCWLKIRDGGKIVALLPIPSMWVTQIPTAGNHNYIVYPYGSVSSNALTVSDEDMVFFKDPDLLDPYGRGRGQAESIGDEIEIDEMAAKFQKNTLYNDGNPPYAIMQPNGNPATAEATKEGFKAKIGGWFHAHEPIVLTGKDVTIQKLSQTMQELDLIESRRFLRDEALHHWQMPPEIFGILENSNRSTIDAAMYLLNKNVISDDIAFFDRVVNRQLVSEYGKDIVLVSELEIQEDEELALKVMGDGLVRGAVKVNEYRVRFGMPAIPGQDIFLRTMSLVEVDPSLPPDPDPDPEPAEDYGDLEIEPDEEIEIEDDEEVLDMDDVKTTKALNDIEAKTWAMFDKKALSVEPLFIKQVKKISTAQNEKLKAIIKPNIETGDFIGLVTAFFNDDTDEAVKRTLAPAWIDSLKAGEDHALMTLGLKSKAVDEVVNPWFNWWVEKYGLLKAKEINDTTHKALLLDLQKVLADSIAAGDSLGNRIKKILSATDGVYENMSKMRASLIATTESATSINAGAFATYKAEGVKKKTWLSSPDERTREDHRRENINPITIDIDEKFIIGGEPMDFPGDPTASAKNVCRCRCSLGPGRVEKE